MTGFFFREEPDPDFPDNPEKMVKVEVSNDVVNAAVVALLEEYKASDLPEADRPGIPPEKNQAVKYQILVFRRHNELGDEPDLGPPFDQDTYTPSQKTKWPRAENGCYNMGIPQRISRYSLGILLRNSRETRCKLRGISCFKL